MSGVAGFMRLDGGRAEKADLDNMLTAIARRGPDGSAVWQQDAIALGQVTWRTDGETSIPGLPAGRTANRVIVSDARIDNEIELIDALGLAGPAAPSGGELILRAYETWGEASVARLLGDFAFAIWDGPGRKLFCARDHLGVRPLYYHRAGGLFAFASEIKALLRLPQVPRRRNEARIADYLVTELEGIDKTSTFYQDIFRLPPGHTLTVTHETFKIARYWSAAPTRESRGLSDQDYAERFRDLLSEAVRCRLRGARAGVMLSGGLDSSAVVAVARRSFAQGNGVLPTFSAVSGRSDCPETRAIRQVLSQGGVEPHTLRPDELNPLLPELELLFDHTDDPFDHLITLPQILYAAARQAGMRVMLDGVDGDMVASLGSQYPAYLVRAGHWRTALAESTELGRWWGEPAYGLMARSVLAAFVPPRLRRLYRRLRPVDVRLATRDTCIRPEFVRRVNLPARMDALRSHSPTSLLPTLAHAHANSLDHPYLTLALERYHRVAAAYSIEARHPFLDLRLVQFCVDLPWQQKIHRGWSKVIVRRAMEGLLPREICWRRDFCHLGQEFLRAWMALEIRLLEETMGAPLEGAAEYVNVPAVRAAFRQYVSGGPLDDPEESLWRPATLALWLRRN